VDARVAVFASGGGTNLQALLDDDVTGPLITLVLSDVPDARALERARAADVEAIVIDPSVGRDAMEAAVLETLIDRGIDTVVLAGYMRIVGPDLVQAYAGRMLNVHPALLPAFPGAHAVADALAYGAKVTGVTVHLVDEGVDTGPVVSQEALDVRVDDDRASLETRIHELEHRLLPRALRALVEGRLQVSGRTVTITEAREP
jgi:phosphoribosylglycinamide formyltransferase-1